MMPSITCFPSIYLFIKLLFHFGLSALSTNSVFFLFHAAHFLYTRAQAPSRLQRQQILYVPVTALMLQSITCFKSIYLLHQFSSSNSGLFALSSQTLAFYSMLSFPVHVTSTKKSYKRQQILLCACNRTYDAKHHLFSKYLPFHQLLFQLAYLPSSINFSFSAAWCLPVHTCTTTKLGYKDSKYFMCL